MALAGNNNEKLAMNNQNELIPLLPGELLRYHREQAGLSIADAAGISRIKPAVLSAIESGETGSIPSVYLRGYIRSYARALGLDPAEIEPRVAGVKGAEPQVQTVFQAGSPRGRTEKWLKASSYVAASAVIAALAWQFTHEAVRFSQGDSQLGAGSAVREEATHTDPDDAPRQLSPANTHLNASIASMEVVQKRAGNTAGEQAWAAIGARPEGADGDAAQPVAQSFAAIEGMHHLTINASADSWIEILDGDDQRIEMDLVRAGSSREYQALTPLRIMVGRASAVELTFDGDAVDLGPHTRGNVARLTLGEAPDETSGENVAADSGEPADAVNR